jgi:lipopolysaccharide biosynthesis protein
MKPFQISAGLMGTGPRLLRGISSRVSSSLNRSRRAGGTPKESDFALGVPFGYTPKLLLLPRVGAVVHIFHAELAHEFARDLRHLYSVCGPTTLLMLTTDSPEKAEAVRGAFASWPATSFRVRIVENRGRDIAPKLTAFVEDYSGFDLLLFLHSKVTEHSPAIGTDWRKKLLAELVGSTEVVESILAVFEAEPETGMLFPQHLEAVRNWTGWEGNFRIAKRLTRHWGVRLKRRDKLDFPSGSMFWARPAALQPIISLGLRANDFPVEPLMNDGTICHAIERLFALSTEHAGYRWYKIAKPEWYEYRNAIVTPQSEDELRQFLTTYQRRLIPAPVR